MQSSSIEWTNATWNPIRGCTRVSEGCRNCYAEGIAKRFSGAGLAYDGLVRFGANEKPQGWSGDIQFVESHLLDPLRWKKPMRIFVNSMSDLFHDGVTDEMLDRIFAVMALSPQHTFQVLTKRPERMQAYLSQAHAQVWDAATQTPHRRVNRVGGIPLEWPLGNVWLGVSVEDQKTADARIPLLLQTAAAVRFISAEPLLGVVDLTIIHALEPCDETMWARSSLEAGDVWYSDDGDISDGPEWPALDWVICGGESGPGARPMHPDWARKLRDQCVAVGVPFFFKQWGEFAPKGPSDSISGFRGALMLIRRPTLVLQSRSRKVTVQCSSAPLPASMKLASTRKTGLLGAHHPHGRSPRCWGGSRSIVPQKQQTLPASRCRIVEARSPPMNKV